MSDPANRPLTLAYQQGRSAWGEGLGRDANPYLVERTAEHYEWLCGYLAARGDALEGLQKEFEKL